MYKRMLIPTDGSEFSRSVSLAGVEFARQLEAEVIGLFVAPGFQYPIYVEVLPPNYPSDQEYRDAMHKAGETYLQPIRSAAQVASLDFRSEVVFSDQIAQSIVHTAREQRCDLIFMGSHGRSGWGQLLLGSVTNKVLSLCDIPVLVHRLAHPAK